MVTVVGAAKRHDKSSFSNISGYVCELAAIGLGSDGESAQRGPAPWVVPKPGKDGDISGEGTSMHVDAAALEGTARLF